MEPCPRPDVRRTTPCCWCRSAGRRSPTTSSRSSRTSPAAGASRASGSRRSASTTSCSAAGRRSTTRTARCSPPSARTSPAHGIDLPVYWGNRNWDPYLADAVTADARRRRHAGRVLPDLRLLVVLLVPAVPREPRRAARGRAARRGSTGCGLLQPPRLHRAGRRRDPRRAGRLPTTSATAPTWSSSPTRSRSTMNERSGPRGGAYLGQHRAAAAYVAERVAEVPAAGTTTAWCSAPAPGRRTCRGSSPTSTTTSRSSPRTARPRS